MNTAMQMWTDEGYTVIDNMGFDYTANYTESDHHTTQLHLTIDRAYMEYKPGMSIEISLDDPQFYEWAYEQVKDELGY